MTILSQCHFHTLIQRSHRQKRIPTHRILPVESGHLLPLALQMLHESKNIRVCNLIDIKLKKR
jgi:hypothetical protein